MTSYFINDNWIIPFDKVNSISLLSDGEIRVTFINTDYTILPKKDATAFKTQYLAWLDHQQPKPRSL